MNLNRILVGLSTLVLCSSALAAAGGGAMPWDAPLTQIVGNFTGPTAAAIALLAVAVSGGMLIFGGELGTFARTLVYVVLVGGVLIGAASITGLYGVAGAVLPDGPLASQILVR